MVEYDAHVATQGTGNPGFEEELLTLGFTRDKLVSRHVTFLKGVPLSSCPLIGTHMTKKYERKDQVREDLLTIRNIMTQYGEVGYVHGEVTSLDTTITSSDGFYLSTPWPVERFDAKIDEKNKKWDIHIAIPVGNLPTQLEELLDYDTSGLYHIELTKTREGRDQVFRIYTMQGISNPREGRELWNVLNNWFVEVKTPHVEMKQETYIGMFKVGNPQIVPPTIGQIRYINQATNSLS